MTLQQVIDIVEDETGCESVTPETRMESLGMDSLDFLALITRLNIPDALVANMEKVHDLWMANDAAMSPDGLYRKPLIQ